MTFPDGWGWRIKVTSDNTQVAASIKGLAIDLSNIASADFWGNVKSDGSDIRITKSDGTTLVARDVISIDTTAETGLIRFDTEDISTSADEDYYLYYGNAAASEPAPSDTHGQYNAYDNNLVGYWIGPGTGTTLNDRGGNQYHATLEGAGWSSGNTMFDIPSVDLTTTDYVSFPNMDSEFSDEGTFIPWLRRIEDTPPNDATKTRGYRFNNASSADHYPWRDGLIYTATFRNARVNSINDGAFDKTNLHRLVIKTSPGANNWVFKQNTFQRRAVTGQSTVSVGGDTTEFGKGDVPGGTSGFWEGYLYSLMLFNRKLSNNEDLTLYNNESDSSGFWTIGSVEETTGAVARRPLSFGGGL